MTWFKIVHGGYVVYNNHLKGYTKQRHEHNKLTMAIAQIGEHN